MYREKLLQPRAVKLPTIGLPNKHPEARKC